MRGKKAKRLRKEAMKLADGGAWNLGMMQMRPNSHTLVLIDRSGKAHYRRLKHVR